MNRLKRTILASIARLSGVLGSTTVGARGEQVAADYLKRAGYRLLERNWRCPMGEIDILALAPDGRTVVVVEVKSGTRSTVVDEAHALTPEVHVNIKKQRKLVTLACQAARRHRWTDRPIRFDVVGVDLSQGADPVVRHHVAAFQSHV